MRFYRHRADGERGQVMPLFALVLPLVLIPAVGLVIDGGYAFAQRRVVQNAADLASLAGTRVVGLALAGNSETNGAVWASVDSTLKANGISAGLSASRAVYVDKTGAPLASPASVANDANAVPSSARGVKVGASKPWNPFFLGILGITNWTASADAISKTGWAQSPGGASVLPIAVNLQGHSPGDVWTMAEGGGPGNFGWMRWADASNWGSATVTDYMLWYPAAKTGYDAASGWATWNSTPMIVPAGGSLSVPGNSGISASSSIRTDLVNWICSGQTVLVPVMTSSSGNGANLTYTVIGFAGFKLTGFNGITVNCGPPPVIPGGGGKITSLEGQWVKYGTGSSDKLFPGPPGDTQQFPGQALAVQLIK